MAAKAMQFRLTGSWISYNWGPYGIGANVLLAPGSRKRMGIFGRWLQMRELCRKIRQENRRVVITYQITPLD